jgi:hypothetical protein
VNLLIVRRTVNGRLSCQERAGHGQCGRQHHLSCVLASGLTTVAVVTVSAKFSSTSTLTILPTEQATRGLLASSYCSWLCAHAHPHARALQAVCNK